MSTVIGDLAITVPSQGDYVEVTTTDLDMSGYADDSVFVISTYPTLGELYLGSMLLVELGTFTRAEYILNKLWYRHAGVGNSADSFDVIARDDPSGTPVDSAPSTVNVTVTATNLGWLLQATMLSNSPILVAYMSTKFEIDQAIIWNASHWGTSSVIEVTDATLDTFLQTLLTKDDRRFVSPFVISNIDRVNGNTANTLATRLMTELDKTAYASIKTEVMTHGSEIEMDPDVYAGISSTDLGNFEKIKADMSVDEMIRTEVPNSDWYGALDIAKANLLTE